MISSITYRGALVKEPSVQGERKCDSVVPTHPAIAQASRKRWIIFFSTLDLRGWDGVKSIVYQLRSNTPDGPVIREGLIVSSEDNWELPGVNGLFSKRCGTPVVFGVPKGAVANGRLLENNNLFVLKWYRSAFLKRDDGVVLSPWHAGHWKKEDASLREAAIKTIRLEWLQFRLNENEDDIEIVHGPELVCQKGYGGDEVFSSLGAGYTMIHALTPPAPEDGSLTHWIEYDTFEKVSLNHPYPPHGRVAPVRYVFNREKRLYEWIDTGNLIQLENRVIGEASIIKNDHGWIIACRDFSTDGVTCWIKTGHPFESGAHDVYFSPQGEGPRQGPRHAYLCADGTLRLFGNESALRVPSRNPLFSWDVNERDFSLANRRTVLDAQAEGLPFSKPYVDFCKLSPIRDNRQYLIFRCINSQTVRGASEAVMPSGQELAASGIHYAEIKYEGDFPDTWSFN
ncbi:MAG: hypothetical protein WC637_03210 [Victivallales bacterium]|jgi:hypothetical protein